MTECGTNAGYHRHRRRGDPACESCLTAHRDYVASRPRLPRGRDCPTCEDTKFLRDSGAEPWTVPGRIGLERRALLAHLNDHRQPALAVWLADRKPADLDPWDTHDSEDDALDPDMWEW